MCFETVIDLCDGGVIDPVLADRDNRFETISQSAQLPQVVLGEILLR